MSFRIAEKQAMKSTFMKHRVGAVIMKGNRVLSTGFNSIRYSSISKQATSHAEAAAIVRLLKEGRMVDLAGSVLYVTRFTKSGVISCARPCDNCLRLIRSVGIAKVFYTDFDGQTQEMKL